MVSLECCANHNDEHLWFINLANRNLAQPNKVKWSELHHHSVLSCWMREIWDEKSWNKQRVEMIEGNHSLESDNNRPVDESLRQT